jgi:hypothetical protein
MAHLKEIKYQLSGSRMHVLFLKKWMHLYFQWHVLKNFAAGVCFFSSTDLVQCSAVLPFPGNYFIVVVAFFK